jgi:hypothetical protein
LRRKSSGSPAPAARRDPPPPASQEYKTRQGNTGHGPAASRSFLVSSLPITYTTCPFPSPPDSQSEVIDGAGSWEGSPPVAFLVIFVRTVNSPNLSSMVLYVFVRVRRRVWAGRPRKLGGEGLGFSRTRGERARREEKRGWNEILEPMDQSIDETTPWRRRRRRRAQRSIDSCS